jgi:hypothetical protein
MLALHAESRGLLHKGVLLLHDNARPLYRGVLPLKQSGSWNFKFSAAPNKLELAPSDYHIFRPLRDTLRGRRFASYDEVQEAVHTWLRSQLKTFLAYGIRKLVNRYTISVEKEGGVEKWYTLHLSLSVAQAVRNTVTLLFFSASYIAHRIWNSRDWTRDGMWPYVVWTFRRH